jgi:hypothetical protein
MNIHSTIYRADLPAWILIGGLSGFPWLIAWSSAPHGEDARNFLIAAGVSGFAFAWLFSFRIVLTATEVTFRSLFRGRQSIRHDEIKRVRLSWSLRGGARGPMRLVIEPRDNSDAREMDINAKVFSREAIDALLDLGARVAEVDDGGLRDGIVMRSLRGWKKRQMK